MQRCRAQAPISGEVDLWFSCSCSHHNYRKKVLKRTIVFEKLPDCLLIPYDLSVHLGIIRLGCKDTDIRIRKTSIKEDPEDLVEMECEPEDTNYDHLSNRMKAFARRFQHTIKDTQVGAQPFPNIPHTPLQLIENSIPIYNSSVRLTPIHLLHTSKGYINKLLEEDIIGVQMEATDWCSPGFFTEKKGSDKHRFVVDFRALNRCLDRSHWPFVSSE